MNRFFKFALYLGAAAFAAPLVAQSRQSTTARTLLRYEDDWAKALVRRDTVYFRRMLAPGFVYTEDAAVMTADEVVRGASTGPDRVTRYNLYASADILGDVAPGVSI